MTNITPDQKITVVGAGLAGSECALQLADMGYKVVLCEMRDKTMTPAHKTHKFAELVCSNSFGTLNEISAPGQLKWEAEHLGSHILKLAKEAAVPAGQALGMDREVFSQLVTDKVKSHPNIEIRNDVIKSLNDVPRPAVIATGPLTHDELAEDLRKHFGDEFLYFFDAIAPIIDAESINTEIAWKADRWGKGTNDYYNCPMNKEEYNNFIQAVIDAKKIEPKDFEKTEFFEGCMPIEVMVDRGPQTLRFGPMKPIGLDDPRTNRYPWAVVQLRQDNKEGTAYNMVGFQTRMAYADQVRVFRMIPGLENAEFLKLGSIHRNLFINSPKRLNKDLSSKNDPWLFFAGQITGVEGYFESTCVGLMVAKFLDQKLKDKTFAPPPRPSAFGSLLEAITDESRAEHFQPTNINMALLPPLAEKERDKETRKKKQIEIARTAIQSWI
ncbi:methylenetetrahydrofolate--tRNA-(uracil(54)-C(5))-methyltransferase (FADH(2)-oxidizing) TrmFO [Bdellovibrio sp. SKB1291214]|uniref:methylenetetrahydrofolate--tRNA-(uracil(54)- C(5))-methyltransferase (FADH(2)-oxidizing) TrmFO n=1 Tax=Bdellovibrio sp. SKB1291214 TaxID=1732569 RepID=UPI000B51868B|nr:methylenetetrahydrofolate--tRNA-(uracil(54)-C(5))-methyltransferase (FADH(2)-oxidizing) TrmFO [Bdellovibrio sp. SKB1291214]UYL08728.1 methylenetetrahydrofolate--tRNA-(uracil(54)-C(5))-methyltransferase (FADH(2)-oxidizing) TrmFO [Bdellovibrio sp. SKB1291214]